MSEKSKEREESSTRKPAVEIKDLPKDIELDDELDSVSGGTTFRVSTTEPSQIIRRPPSPPRIGYPDK